LKLHSRRSPQCVPAVPLWPLLLKNYHRRFRRDFKRDRYHVTSLFWYWSSRLKNHHGKTSLSCFAVKLIWQICLIFKYCTVRAYTVLQWQRITTECIL
jgi:hypothetical protein